MTRAPGLSVGSRMTGKRKKMLKDILESLSRVGFSPPIVLLGCPLHNG